MHIQSIKIKIARFQHSFGSHKLFDIHMYVESLIITTWIHPPLHYMHDII
jgi:hypothetical protein